MTAESRVAEIDGRSERLLDAAADLLVRWGYRRVTIDDVARHAGIGKGTVYLHFRTKEELFLVVMLRVHRQLHAQLSELMTADPMLALPWRSSRLIFERIAADPVARPVYLGDPEILGRLAHESATTFVEIGRHGVRLMRDHLALMREAGLVRTDLPVDDQVDCLAAVLTGFFAAEQELDGPSVARRAELLEHTLAALLRVPGVDEDPAVVAAVAPAVVAGDRALLAHLDEEWTRRIR